jgi:hypothetical protein
MNQNARLCILAIVAASAGCDGTSSAGGEKRFRTERLLADASAGEADRPFRQQAGRILTDTFEVRHELNDGRLTLALSSDLGDAARLRVSVSRSYQERGSTVRYPVDYQDEASTVGAWRQPRTIDLDDVHWMTYSG